MNQNYNTKLILKHRYQVSISYDNKTDTYPIKYTFGYFPLQ